MIRTVGALVGVADKAHQLAEQYEARLKSVRAGSADQPKLRVYFEEWDDPMIGGIGWVSELIEIAGGVDVLSARASGSTARDRIVTSDEVIAAQPDVILASWCGKKVRPERIVARPGWNAVPAVATGNIYEIKSPLILQPGPAALTDGLDQIVGHLRQACRNGNRP